MKEYVSKLSEPSEPHFDDERTLLSARPVVPLNKIQAKVRHRRHWFLGGAFAVAMMLGAASALLASYLKLRNAPQPTVEATQEVEAAPLAVAESAPTEAPAIENAEPSPEPSVTPKKAVAPKHGPVVVTNPEPIGPSDTRQMSEEDQLHQIRDAVLYDEWQERRARRAMRHERRRNERYNHRDLSNLDEIFEGRPRPN